jgi:septum formation protein
VRLILASASPARLETLRRAGVHPSVIVSEVDESAVTLDDIEDLVGELARLKAEAVAAQVLPLDEVVIVGCDTMLEIDGKPYGKPGSPEAAVQLWHRLSGVTGTLVTGHHVIVSRGGQQRRATRNAVTLVHFADLSDAEMEAYAATGEPENVAGGFTIDGFGGPFVTGLEGDPHNVVGISLPLLRMMLADLGVTWHDLWTAAG